MPPIQPPQIVSVSGRFALHTLCTRLRSLEQQASALAREAAVARGVRRIDDTSAKLLINTHLNIQNARIQLEVQAGLLAADETNVVGMKAAGK